MRRDTQAVTRNRPLSATTLRIYADDWRAFCDWCSAKGLPTGPASPEAIATYLTARQPDVKLGGLRVILAAIGFHHRAAGLPWSAADPAIAAVLQAVKGEGRSHVRPAAPLALSDLERLIASCDYDPGGSAGFLNLRDRALLLVCFAGGLRRSELVALDREDLEIAAQGLTLRIRRGPDAQADDPIRHIAREHRSHLCAVRAMETWLRRARIDYGAVFPRLTAAGTVEARLTGNGVWKILRRRAALAELESPAGRPLSPHAMRASFITAAFVQGASDTEVMALARTKDASAIRRYRPRGPRA